MTAPHVHTWVGTHDRGIVCAVCGEPKPDHGALRGHMIDVLIRFMPPMNERNRRAMAGEATDALLAGPLATVLAERDELRATIARINVAQPQLEACICDQFALSAERHRAACPIGSAWAIRRALDADA